MPEFSVKAWYANDDLKLNDVSGEKYPEGKTYTIPAPSAADELILRRIVQLEDKITALVGPASLIKQDGETDEAATARMEKLIAEMEPLQKEHDDLLRELDRDADGNPIDHSQKMLGPVYDEMLADGVRPRMIDEFAALVTTNYGSGERVARMVVARAEGEALARANRATRRAAAKSTPRKPRASKPKAGSKSSPASSDSGTPATPRSRSTSASKTSAGREQTQKTA